MRAAPITPKRCAVYTRKSTEHNLDLAFNSLDAQREACEAYIKSQAHEGWRLQPRRFDDGGLSGASLERPALQALLAEVRARRVDVIVVYKVDRLTRALADFAKLVELFDAHDVSFVSVTQSFNTTTSMGRLTLNVLLSFAQFEREVIGERVRDKIAASKRKGIWVGGPLPLGYRCRDKQVQVVPEQADAVRSIFDRYLVTRSVGRLAGELAEAGIVGRSGALFGTGALAHLLRNGFYVGEVSYHGEICPGPQPAIVERATFDAVQACLDAQAVVRRHRRTTGASPLAGLIFDERGIRLTPSHTSKKGVRYRYYVSQAVLQQQPKNQHKGEQAKATVRRLAAEDIETAVVGAIRAYGTVDPAASDYAVIAGHLRRVTVGPGALRIEMTKEQQRASPDDSGGGEDAANGFEDGDRWWVDADAEREGSEPEVNTVVVPWSPQPSGREKGVRGNAAHNLSDAARDRLLLAIAKARRWMADVADRRCSFADIARREGCVERHVRYLAPLAYVSPAIVRAIADGTAPADLTVSALARALPHGWAEQERRLLDVV